MEFTTLIHAIIGIIRGTPVWVWAIFAFLIYRGASALHTRTVPLWTTFLLPTFFLGLAITSLIKSPCASCYTLSMWLFALISGTAIAWFLNRALFIKADKRKMLIQLPGSASTLILVIGIFAVKYFFGYMAVVHPAISSMPSVTYIRLALYGGITGLTIGKLLQYLYKYYNAQSVDLVK